MSHSLTILVVGATGDLAQRKLFPALFACFARGHLPQDVRFVGLARTSLDDAAFRQRLADGLKCEEIAADACSLKAGEFLQRCHYCRCEYDSAADFTAVETRLLSLEGGRRGNRVIYLAVPPFVFGPAARVMAQTGLLLRSHSDVEPWTRLVVEKPFGHDRASYAVLQSSLADISTEEQTYRIDHYLGKEMVQNLLVLRFANSIFEPLWRRNYVSHVHISWSETRGVSGRAGYFDKYGIIRDVMQNHLMQIMSLLAMERPVRLDAESIRDAKVAVLQKIIPLEPDDLLVGQYASDELVVAAGRRKAVPGGGDGFTPSSANMPRNGYLQEDGVPPGSRTPTYAAAVLYVDTPRWQGVPFLLTAGKGLCRTRTEVRIHFRDEATLFDNLITHLPCYAENNELIIRVQPDEKLALRIVSKEPGVGLKLGTTELDLRFREKYPTRRIADAYENLLLDVVRGDRSLFIRSDELEAAWDIFTPALQQQEAQQMPPLLYGIGSCGPESLDVLAAAHGIADARVVEQSE